MSPNFSYSVQNSGGCLINRFYKMNGSFAHSSCKTAPKQGESLNIMKGLSKDSLFILLWLYTKCWGFETIFW